MITVYVLRSASHDIHYVGMTSNLPNRLKEHNSKKTKFTAAFTHWEVIYTETAPDFKTGRAREKYLKSATGRRFIQKKLNEEP